MNEIVINYLEMCALSVDSSKVTTSLCPILGKTHAELFKDSCPLSLENPEGKELKVSFIGISPYIIFDPFGGSEVDLIRIFAKKFKFTPKFIPEKSFDIVQANGTTHGMFHRVRCSRHTSLTKIRNFFFLRYQSKKVRWALDNQVFLHIDTNWLIIYLTCTNMNT